MITMQQIILPASRGLVSMHAALSAIVTQVSNCICSPEEVGYRVVLFEYLPHLEAGTI